MGNQTFTCLGGKKLRKSAAILETLGDLDELVAVLGVARSFIKDKALITQVLNLQDELISIGGWLAGVKNELLLKEKTAFLEKKIDQLKDTSLKNFSRPGANQISAFLHLTRAVTRRLERRVVGLRMKKYRPLIEYLNRLSLLLFWLAVKKEK